MQCEQVLRYMQETGPITPLEALKNLGVMRLGARVYDLKKRGHNIARSMVLRKTRNGQAFVAQYELKRRKK